VASFLVSAAEIVVLRTKFIRSYPWCNPVWLVVERCHSSWAAIP